MATDFSPGGIEASLGTATDKWKAAYIENIYGNVEGTIDKAIKDANGNVIHTYYTPKDNLKSKGNATTPVYIDANGVAQPITSYGGKADTAGEADTAKACTGNAATATKATNDKNGNDIAATYVPLSNEAYKAVTANGIHHNGIYRGKNLGTINNLAEVEAFLTAHTVSNGTFADLYLGDYFILPAKFTGIVADASVKGTNWQGVVQATAITGQVTSCELEIVAFNHYKNKGDTALNKNHIVLKPRKPLMYAPMNGLTSDNKQTTVGGYYNSYMHQTVIPQINAVFEQFFGSHLLTRRALLSNATSTTIASMAGSGWMGATTRWSWYDVKACLMSEVAVYGSTVFSSAFWDVGEDNEKLPVYNFKNHVADYRETFWLRAVASSSHFAYANGHGVSDGNIASIITGVVPLICVG